MSRKPLVPKFALMHFECDNSISVVLTKSVDWLEFGKLGHCKDGAKRPVGRVLKMADTEVELDEYDIHGDEEKSDDTQVYIEFKA